MYLIVTEIIFGGICNYLLPIVGLVIEIQGIFSPDTQEVGNFVKPRNPVLKAEKSLSDLVQNVELIRRTCRLLSNFRIDVCESGMNK